MTVNTKIGFGPKVAGEVVVLTEPVSREINSSLGGKILLFLTYVPREFLEKAGLVGVRGIVVPSIHWRDFDYFVRNDDFSLLVLTKFGKLEISKDLAEKLSKLSGKKASLDGDKHELSAN